MIAPLAIKLLLSTILAALMEANALRLCVETVPVEILVAVIAPFAVRPPEPTTTALAEALPEAVRCRDVISLAVARIPRLPSTRPPADITPDAVSDCVVMALLETTLAPVIAPTELIPDAPTTSAAELAAPETVRNIAEIWLLVSNPPAVTPPGVEIPADVRVAVTERPPDPTIAVAALSTPLAVRSCVVSVPAVDSACTVIAPADERLAAVRGPAAERPLAPSTKPETVAIPEADNDAVEISAETDRPLLPTRAPTALTVPVAVIDCAESKLLTDALAAVSGP